MGIQAAEIWIKENYSRGFPLGDYIPRLLAHYAEDYHAKRMTDLPAATNDTQAGYLEQELEQAKDVAPLFYCERKCEHAKERCERQCPMCWRMVKDPSFPQATPAKTAEVELKELKALLQSYFEIEHQIRKKL